VSQRKDRWEVKACESCGFERRIRVNYRFLGSSEKDGWWKRTCPLCEAKTRVRMRQYDLRKALEGLKKEEEKRARELARREKKPLDRTPKEVTYHLRVDQWERAVYCGARTDTSTDDPNEANCKKCLKKLDLENSE
jgi:hypothetical protein